MVEKTVEMLKQDVHELIDMPTQITTIYALSKGLMDDLNLDQVKQLENEITQGLRMNDLGMKIQKELMETKKLPKDEGFREIYQRIKEVDITWD